MSTENTVKDFFKTGEYPSLEDFSKLFKGVTIEHQDPYLFRLYIGDRYEEVFISFFQFCVVNISIFYRRKIYIYPGDKRDFDKLERSKGFLFVYFSRRKKIRTFEELEKKIDCINSFLDSGIYHLPSLRKWKDNSSGEI